MNQKDRLGTKFSQSNCSSSRNKLLNQSKNCSENNNPKRQHHSSLEVTDDDLEVGIHCPRSTVVIAAVAIDARHDVGTLVLTHTLFEKVRLSLQRDHLHPLKRILGMVEFLMAKSENQSIGNKLDVLLHERSVHANEFDWEGLRDELLFDLDCIADNAMNSIGRQLVSKLAVQQASEICVKAFITGDELVRKCETGHEATLFQPEDRAE